LLESTPNRSVRGYTTRAKNLIEPRVPLISAVGFRGCRAFRGSGVFALADGHYFDSRLADCDGSDGRYLVHVGQSSPFLRGSLSLGHGWGCVLDRKCFVG